NEIKEALSEADAGHFASADDVKSAFSKWGVNAD
ncbi:CopG family transcriptional regulator, partial [Vibrio parahaemolyticus]|nr:CopG family transcriptional regulator [Vibrio parahaemolyticus]